MISGFIEWFALIVALIVIVKLLVILVNPKKWLDIVSPIYKRPMLLMIVSLVLAALVLNYLLAEGMTIVQIFAVMLLLVLLAAISVSMYAKEILDMGKKLLKDKKIIKKAWISIVVWLALSIWVLVELFL